MNDDFLRDPYLIRDMLADELLRFTLSREEVVWSGRPTPTSVACLDRLIFQTQQYCSYSLLLLLLLFFGGGAFTAVCALKWVPLPVLLVLILWGVGVGVSFSSTLLLLVHLHHLEQEAAAARFSRYALTRRRVLVINTAVPLHAHTDLSSHTPYLCWIPLKQLSRLERCGAGSLRFSMEGKRDTLSWKQLANAQTVEQLVLASRPGLASSMQGRGERNRQQHSWDESRRQLMSVLHAVTEICLLSKLFLFLVCPPSSLIVTVLMSLFTVSLRVITVFQGISSPLFSLVNTFVVQCMLILGYVGSWGSCWFDRERQRSLLLLIRQHGFGRWTLDPDDFALQEEEEQAELAFQSRWMRLASFPLNVWGLLWLGGLVGLGTALASFVHQSFPFFVLFCWLLLTLHLVLFPLTLVARFLRWRSHHLQRKNEPRSSVVD